MATILRAADLVATGRASATPHRSPLAAFNFDDLAAEADRCLADARAEADAIIVQAQAEAESIRSTAAEEVDQLVVQRTLPVLSALSETVKELRHAKQQWLAHWEAAAVHLAAGMAERVIRRELPRQPEITLLLVREALELAAGSPAIRVHLNPKDYKLLGPQVRAMIDAMSAVGGAEIVSDSGIAEGGARVETRFGTIDQQITSQLNRIEEELVG